LLRNTSPVEVPTHTRSNGNLTAPANPENSWRKCLVKFFSNSGTGDP
jgi:hypothetical protein